MAHKIAPLGADALRLSQHMLLLSGYDQLGEDFDGFSRRLHGIPVVASETERDLLYPTPNTDQRVMIRGTGAVQRYTGTTWVTDASDALNVQTFGALGDGVTDDSAAIQACLTAAGLAGKRVTIPYTSAGYSLGTTGITIGSHLMQVDANGAELKYYGTGVAVDFTPIDGVYPVNCELRRLNVRVTAVGATAFRPRVSYSRFEGCYAVLTANDQTAWELLGDGAGGSGPYYNNFYDCGAQGSAPTSTGQETWKFTYDAAVPTRCPNTNKWYGGRSGQVDVGARVNGAGNRFYGTTFESSFGQTFIFNHPTEPTGCVDNGVHGAYVENAGVAFQVGANAIGTVIEHPYITGATTSYTDAGTNTRIILSDESLVPAEGLVWAMRAAGLWPTVEGTVAGYRARLPDGDGRGWTATVGASATGEGTGYFELYTLASVLLAAFGTTTATLGATKLLLANSALGLYSGTGTPEGAVTAPVGSLYVRTDGGASTTLYVKESGALATGWVAK